MSVYGRFLAASLTLPQGGEWHPFKRKAAAAHPFKQKAAAQHPFQSLAGAQHPFNATAGAWHPFFSRGGALHPFDPAGVGLHPFAQTGTGLHPFAAQAASASAGDDVWPSPWLGIDPDWVYGSAEALQAQAMRRVSTELGGLVAPPANDAQSAQSEDKAQGQERQRRHDGSSATSTTDPLWRWGAEFRGKALIAELASRVFVHDKTVMLVPQPGGAAVKALAITLGKNFTDEHWADQIDKVLRAAVEREDRLPEILTQAGSFWDYFGMASGLNLQLAPRTAELIEVATEWATLVVMALKNQLAVLRPMQRNPLVMPVIETPTHGALPSGHATVARLYADLLTELLYTDPRWALRKRQLDVLARRIAFNRVVAGVHFQADSVAGHHLGRLLAASLISLARGGPMQLGWKLEIPAEASLGEREAKEPSCKLDDKPVDIGAASEFKKLWDAALTELADLRV